MLEHTTLAGDVAQGAPKDPRPPQGIGVGGTPIGEGVHNPPVPDRQVLQLHRVVHEIPWMGGTLRDPQIL